MTHQQKALVRYWLIGLAVLVTPFWLSGHEHFRLFLLLALVVVAVIDKTMRLPRPEGAPMPLQVIENSRAWKAFFILYAIAAVFMAVLSVVNHDLGTWFSQNSWLVIPLVLAPILGPVVQSEVAIYKACDEKAP